MSPMNGATGRLIRASQIHTQSIRNTTAKQTKNIFWVILSIKKLPQRDQSVTTSVGKLRMQVRQSLIFPLSSSFGCHTHQADLEANPPAFKGERQDKCHQGNHKELQKNYRASFTCRHLQLVGQKQAQYQCNTTEAIYLFIVTFHSFTIQSCC